MKDVNHSGVNRSIDVFDETEFCVRRYTNFVVFSSGYENVSRQTFYDYHNEVTTELMIKPREGYSEESKYATGFSFTKSLHCDYQFITRSSWYNTGEINIPKITSISC